MLLLGKLIEIDLYKVQYSWHRYKGIKHQFECWVLHTSQIIWDVNILTEVFY